MEPSNAGEAVSQITRSALPVTVSGVTLLGVTLNEWVLIVTLIYTIMQAAWFFYSKFIKREREPDGS